MSIVNRGLLTSVSTQLISLDMWSPVKTYVLQDDAPHIYIDVPCAFIHSCLVLPKLKAEAWLWILGIRAESTEPGAFRWRWLWAEPTRRQNQPTSKSSPQGSGWLLRSRWITWWVLGVCPQSATSNSPRCHHCLEAKCWSGVSSLSSQLFYRCFH